MLPPTTPTATEFLRSVGRAMQRRGWCGVNVIQLAARLGDNAADILDHLIAIGVETFWVEGNRTDERGALRACRDWREPAIECDLSPEQVTALAKRLEVEESEVRNG